MIACYEFHWTFHLAIFGDAATATVVGVDETVAPAGVEFGCDQLALEQWGKVPIGRAGAADAAAGAADTRRTGPTSTWSYRPFMISLLVCCCFGYSFALRFLNAKEKWAQTWRWICLWST